MVASLHEAPRGLQHRSDGARSRHEHDGLQAGGGPAARGLEAHQQHHASSSREVEPVQELQEVMQLLAQQQPWLQQRLHQQPLEVSVLKGMKGAPRGTTAKEWHKLSTSRALTFAEQIELQVPGQSVVLTCKDKARRTTCAIVAPTAEGLSPCIAEPFAVYQMPDGIWWMEYHRLHRAQDVIELAAAGGKTLSLPSGFAAGQELLKDTGREHCRLSAVVGCTTVSRSKREALNLKHQHRMQPSEGGSWQPSQAQPLQQQLLCVAQLQVQQRYTFDSRLVCVLTESSASPL